MLVTRALTKLEGTGLGAGWSGLITGHGDALAALLAAKRGQQAAEG